MEHIVIGIEGLVGAGKTSICKKLLDYIPNSILLHGGNIYRAIVAQLLQKGIPLNELKAGLTGADIFSLMKKLGIEIRLEERETVVYANGKKINEEDLQSEESSMAVSTVSQVANNESLYTFGKKLIDSFRKDFNLILSSRDIMKMYPETTYHILITASLEERVRRKCIQYEGKIKEDEVREMIVKRDELQEESGYYTIYSNTQKIDVTKCKTVEASVLEVLKELELPIYTY